MAVRPIDANAMLNELRPVSFEAEHSAVLVSDVSKMVREWVERQPTLTPPNDWISVKDRLPEAEKEVWIACKTKPSGYLYQCVGFYIPHGFYQEDSDYTWDWEALGEYSEERDDYCINEGWYERVHNWDDYGAVVIGDFVTHWMPLPQPPKEEAP